MRSRRCTALALPLLLLAAGAAAQSRTQPSPQPPAQAAPPAEKCPYQPEMTFTAYTSKLGAQFGTGEREYIFADGAICPDTNDKFVQFLKDNPPKSPYAIVVLNSPGGDLAAGLDLGQTIRDHKMWTEVGSRFPLLIGESENIPQDAVPYLQKPAAPPFPGYCYSSCTFAFMGGVYRSISYASNYGVHRFEFEKSDKEADAVDAAQMASATLVRYIVAMGVSSDYMSEMVKKGGGDVTNLSSATLRRLKIVTPGWKSRWRVEPLSDHSGFFLKGNSTDAWGTHEIAVSCAPKDTVAAPAPAEPGQSKPPAVALVTVSLDPGPRAKADEVVSAVQGYVLELGSDWITLPSRSIAQKAVVAQPSKRLTATLEFTERQIEMLAGNTHIGFAFMFDPNAKLPLRLLQFESDLDSAKLKDFVATCH